jgi:CubicO group peptidase (beta-lactamase class C family)
VATTAALLLAACGDDGGDDTDPDGADVGDAEAAAADGTDAEAEAEAVGTVFPGDDWDHADPGEMGFDPDTLEQLADEAGDHGTQCLVVVRNGQIVAEWYWDDTDENTPLQAWSVTKSYTSSLVGIAAADGDLDLDEPVTNYVEEWVGTESEDVLVRHLISNNSGRSWMASLGFGDTYAALTAAEDRTARAVDLGQDAPAGETWEYNDGAIQVLDTVLEQATGQSPAEYARERLLDPIGAGNSEMSVDAAGGTAMYFDLRTTCQDMARYGHLMLNDGVWDGEQVLPEGWVEEATSPAQELNAANGYLWWVNAEGAQVGVSSDGSEDGEATENGRMIADAPEDMYWAQGLGGQTIQVHPATGTVVTRMDADVDSSYGSRDTARFITEALVEE